MPEGTKKTRLVAQHLLWQIAYAENQKGRKSFGHMQGRAEISGGKTITRRKAVPDRRKKGNADN